MYSYYHDKLPVFLQTKHDQHQTYISKYNTEEQIVANIL